MDRHGKKAENGDEPKSEPEAKKHRSTFLQSIPQARHESTVSERAFNLFRVRAKSDGVLAGPSFTQNDARHSPGLPSVPRIEAGPVPFELQGPPAPDRETLYDVDIVAVHAYGEDLQSAWTAEIPINLDNDSDADMYGGANTSHDQEFRPISGRTSEENLIKSSPKVNLPSTPNLTEERLHKQRLEEVKKAKFTQEWIIRQKTPASDPEGSLNPAVAVQFPTANRRTIRWLRDREFLPGRISTARVLLFQYGIPVDDGQPPSLTEVTKALATRLERARRDDPNRPIVFIGHDFGITVIEATLIGLWRDGRGCDDNSQDGRALEYICQATAGLVFLATEGPTSNFERSFDYFDIAVRRSPGPGLTEIPFAETKRDQFLVQHLDNFHAFTSELAETRPAPTLKCLISAGKITAQDDTVYKAVLELIAGIQQEYGLLVSACTGQLQMVRWYLRAGRSPNTRNESGQSALLLAVRNGRQNVVRLLVKTFNADVTLCDRNGQTPLHLAIMHHPNKQELMETLLKRGADVNAKNCLGFSPLDLARESKELSSILKKRPPVDGPSENSIPGILNDPIAPRLSDAVHACYYFRATLAEFYIVGGRERFIYDQPSVHEVLYESGPAEILEALRTPAIDKERVRCRWFHLPANNVAWIDDLFVRMRISADPIVENQHEGPTQWSHYMRPQARIFRPIKHSKNASGHWTISEYSGRHYMLFMPYLNYEAACDQNILYKVVKEGPSKEAGQLAFYEAENATRGMKLKIDTTVKPRSHFLSIPQTAEASPHSAEPSPHPDFPADKFGEFLSSKIISTLDSFPGIWRGTSKGDEDWEGLRDLRSDSDRLRKEIALIRGYLYKLETSKTTLQGTKQLGPLHIRRTLDQSHYFMLTSTRTRDKDQVVLRAARRASSAAATEDSTVVSSDQENFEEVNEPPYSDQEEYPLLMVDQLWLWVIGDTVVTCFPQKWTRDSQDDRQQEGDVLDELLHYLRTNKRRPLIREPQDLVNVIISQCTGVFNRPRAKLGLPLHDHFESSVGRVADQEMKLFRRFELASKIDPTIPEQKDEEGKRLDKLFDIHSEVKLLDETKDIRDELRMILRVVNDQALVITDMASVLKPIDGQADTVSPPASPQKGQLDQSSLHMVTQTVTEGAAEGPIRSETFSIAYKNRHPIIDANIRDFDRMLAHANASYEALNHLLDLKQKHANVTEARSARKGAEESARQGNTIMFFTIVTIIFGSSSFITAFFALNITAFPKDANNATSWHLGEITGIVAGISIGLAIPFIIVAFNINRLLALRNIPKRQPGHSSTVVQRKGVFTNPITFQRLRDARWVHKMKNPFHIGKKEKADPHDQKENEQMDEKGSTTAGHPHQGPSGMVASQSMDVDQASHEVVYTPTAGTQQ